MKTQHLAAALAAAIATSAFAADRPELIAYPVKTDVSASGSYDNGSAVGTDYVVSGTISGALTFSSDVPYRVTLDNATLDSTMTLGGDATLWLKGTSTLTTTDAAAISSTGTLAVGGPGSATLTSAPVKKATGVVNAIDMTVAGGSMRVVLDSQVKNSCGIAVTGDYEQMAGNVYIDATCCDTNKVNGLYIGKKKKSATISGGTLSVSVDGPKSIGISLDKATTAMTLSGGVVDLFVYGAGGKGIKSDKDDCELKMTGGILSAEVTGGVVYENYEDSDGSNYVVSVSSTSLLSQTGKYVVQDTSPAYAVKVANIDVSGGTVRVSATGVSSRGLCADGDGGTFNISGGFFDITCDGDASDTVLEMLDESALTTEIDKATACGIRVSETNGTLVITDGTLNIVANGTGGKCIVSKGTMVVGPSGQTTTPSDSSFAPDIQATTYGEQVYVAAKKQKSYLSVGTATIADLSATTYYCASNHIVSSSGDSVDYSNPKDIKAEDDLTVYGGRIRVFSQADGGEGLESKATLTFEGGIFEGTTYDDCINAGDSLVVNGGYLYCGATNNDCIDSNGSGSDSIVINGGIVLCFTAATPECGIDTDYSGGIQMNGGTIISFGSATDMAYGSCGDLVSYKSTSISSSTYTGKYLVLSGGSKTVYAKVPSLSSSTTLSLVCTTDGCTSSAPSISASSSASGTDSGFHGVYFK